MATGTTFDISQLKIGTTGDGHAPAFAIDGTLRTDTLSYTSRATRRQSSISIPAACSISEPAFSTAGLTSRHSPYRGSNAGGHLELGSLSVVNAVVHVSFENAGANVHNTGVIEYLSGFTTGSSTSQVISNVAWGDSFIIDGANFTGDTATLTRRPR